MTQRYRLASREDFKALTLAWNERVQQESKKKLAGENYLRIGCKLPDHLIVWHQKVMEREQAAGGLRDMDVACSQALFNQLMSQNDRTNIGPPRQLENTGPALSAATGPAPPPPRPLIGLHPLQHFAAPGQGNVVAVRVQPTAALQQVIVPGQSQASSAVWPVCPNTCQSSGSTAAIEKARQ